MIIRRKKNCKWSRIPNNDPNDVADEAEIEICYKRQPLVRITWVRHKYATTAPDAERGPWRLDNVGWSGSSYFNVSQNHISEIVEHTAAKGEALAAAAIIIKKFGPNKFTDLPRTTKALA